MAETRSTQTEAEAREALLALLTALARELRPGREPPPVSLDTDLERELGIDSLARVELLLRLERDLGRHVPEHVALEAATPRELLAAWRRLPAAGTVPVTRAPDATGARRVPTHAATLVEVLAWHAETAGERTAIHLYGDADAPEPVSYADLHRGAAAVAAGLRERGVAPGDTVAVMLPTGVDFFYCYYGALLAGAVPVPLYPPQRRAQIGDHLTRQRGILDNAAAVALITVEAARGVSHLVTSQLPALRHLCTPEELRADAAGALPLGARPDDLALIQYTSGSTGQPKGVALSHANLLANVRAMGEAAAVNDDDVFVSWLPLYHDMGLIGACFGTLYHGLPLVLMSPLSFIARPARWLQVIHRHRGTLSAAPNFAYDLCARRLRDADLKGLDLSCWRLAFNGAEPVHAGTLARFQQRLAGTGWPPEAMTPVYGLAENAVGLAFPPPGRGPRIDRIDRHGLSERGLAEPSGAGEARAVVGCGRALPHHELRVVDRRGRPLPERHIGRIQFRGPSATAGYYRNPDATRALFQDGWLETGDDGYLAEGELFLTGRSKDLIIRAGRNIYPYELEQAVGELPGVGKDAVAVFASPDPDSGLDRLIVAAETRHRDTATRDALRRRIETVTTELTGVAPDDVTLVPPRSILKTSSGKIRRAACRDLYEAGTLGRRRAPGWQLARLAVTGAGPMLRRVVGRAAERVHAGWVWTWFGLVGLPLWLALAVLPGTGVRHGLARAAARLLAAVSGVRLALEGREHLPAAGGWVLAANHASYIDGPVLTALLPRRVRFVAKAELAGQRLAGTLLRRLDTLFVQRTDTRQGVADSERLTAAVRAGDALGFFPEGTFTDYPGLLPFRMGAFVAAARAGAPVVPVAVRGSRRVLRGTRWLPRPGRITVVVGPPLLPAGTDWDAALALRDRTRAWILEHCGEPDLGRVITP